MTINARVGEDRFGKLLIGKLLIDRDRGEPRSSAPPTPPCVRVRTRRFEKWR